MTRNTVVQLEKYENITTGDVYYGYPIDEAITKIIDGSVYVEVTDDLKRPKFLFIRAANLRRVGKVTIEVNDVSN